MILQLFIRDGFRLSWIMDRLVEVVFIIQLLVDYHPVVIVGCYSGDNNDDHI